MAELVEGRSSYSSLQVAQAGLGSPCSFFCNVTLSSLLVVLADPARIDEKFRKAWLPYFCRSGQRETSLEEFTHEVEGWLPFLPEVALPRLTWEMLAEVVHRKGATAGSLDGWGWREFKALPVSVLSKVEDTGVWPEGLLVAYIATIPKTDRDATSLGQRPLSVLPIAYRIWASGRMLQLEGWFQSWVPDSVCSAGAGRSSFEAWYTALVLSCLGLPGWLRRAYFEYHPHVRLRF